MKLLKKLIRIWKGIGLVKIENTELFFFFFFKRLNKFVYCCEFVVKIIYKNFENKILKIIYIRMQRTGGMNALQRIKKKKKFKN